MVLTSSGLFNTTSFVDDGTKWSRVMKTLGRSLLRLRFTGLFLAGVGELFGGGGAAFLFLLLFTSVLEKIIYHIFFLVKIGFPVF